MVVHRNAPSIQHCTFLDLPSFLNAGDVLVFNNTRVIPARLHGEKKGTGGEVEMFLVEQVSPTCWWCLAKPGKRLRPGTQVTVKRRDGTPSMVLARLIEKNPEGHCLFAFEGCPDLLAELDGLGEVPLPPYIRRAAGPDGADHQRYQTVFAKHPGSVAAPTAGLHFSPELLERLQAMGVVVRFVTLHVGLGTFAPVKSERVEDHVMHFETYELGEAAVEAIRLAKARGNRVVAVGTTSLRTLEGAARAYGLPLSPGRGRTNLFLYPPARFEVVDALLTNFHLPESTLLMLVCAFASPGTAQGREVVLNAYEEAVRLNYRFFSYGDAMLLL